jgi:hypothetical protein
MPEFVISECRKNIVSRIGRPGIPETMDALSERGREE